MRSYKIKELIMEIYKTTNLINKKIYIGKQKTPDPTYLGSGVLIKRAITKYGKENFIKESIDISPTSVKELNERETFWISFYNSTDLTIGYNISKGGDGGDMFSNNPNKEEIRKHNSHTGDKNAMFGRNHSIESIEKIKKNRKGKLLGVATWNKGVSIKNYSEKYKAFFEGTKGKDNGMAKIFTFISPDNIEYTVIGEFWKFCIEHNINTSVVGNFVDKGKIPAPQKGMPKPARANLIGWEIIRGGRVNNKPI